MFPKEILLCIFQVCIAIAIMHFAQAEAQAGRSFKHEDREDTFPNIGCHAVTCEKNGSLVIRAHCASSPDCCECRCDPATPRYNHGTRQCVRSNRRKKARKPSTGSVITSTTKPVPTSGFYKKKYFYSEGPATVSTAPGKQISPRTIEQFSGNEGHDYQPAESNGIMIAATVVSVVTVAAVCAAVYFCTRRRRVTLRRRKPFISKVNATYERGPDNSIKLIIIGEAQEETDITVIDEEGNHYQPLVQNTVIRDASGMQPVYQELDKTQSKADHPVTSERYSMVKYQSLHRPEHSANDYQTLEQMKTGKQLNKSSPEANSVLRSGTLENDYDYVYPNSMTSSDDVGCDSDGNDSLSCYSAGTDGIDPHNSQITEGQ